jgi:predicted nucleic acid-binding protein
LEFLRIHFSDEFALSVTALGESLGANDLWIAASAIANQTPRVTRNAREFRRVPGLEVMDY